MYHFVCLDVDWLPTCMRHSNDALNVCSQHLNNIKALQITDVFLRRMHLSIWLDYPSLLTSISAWHTDVCRQESNMSTHHCIVAFTHAYLLTFCSDVCMYITHLMFSVFRSQCIAFNSLSVDFNWLNLLKTRDWYICNFGNIWLSAAFKVLF